MKIAQVAHCYLPCVGGIELYVHRLTEDLQKLGRKVEVLSTDMNTPLKHRKKEARYFKTSFSFMRNPFSFELMKHLKKNRYDLFHVHNIWFIPGLLATYYRKKAKIITTLHGIYPDRANFWQSFFLNIYKPLARYILAKSDKIIVADCCVHKLIKIFKIDPHKIVAIPNGIRLIPYKARKKENIILFSGRIIPDKNPEVLIKAACLLNRMYADFKLVFIGPVDEKYKMALTRLVQTCGLKEKTAFLSPLNQSLPAERARLMDLYRKSYVFVALSFWEGIPTRLLEAMQFRVPCIALASGGIRELIRDDDNGMIINTLDKNLLAQKLSALFRNRALAERLGKNARLTVQKHFNWSKLSSRIIALYDEVAAR
jgi:glycosyltransferase involved in cell wall biosynthesis